MRKKFQIYFIVLTGLILTLFFSCKKEPVYTVPTVVLSVVTNISTDGAASGGDILNEGSGPVSTKGVCWSTSQNPTIGSSKTADGTGTGSFTSTISGLQPGKTYYIRAYAINAYGTGYSDQSSFRTSSAIPTVTTLNLNGLSPASATGGGNISSDGGENITSRGICWSTNQNPTIADYKTNDGTGSGSFTSSITGLGLNMIYYFRAYATNKIGTAYGNQVTAITLAGSQIITDGFYNLIKSATTGKGVDLVFMGDGYTPSNILAGNYENNIRQAYAAFFDIEPFKTYASYFNVYMVFAFSDESGISDLNRTVNTKFETTYTGGLNSTLMFTNYNTVSLYSQKAPIIDINNTTAIVIANSTRYGGTTHTHAGQKGLNISICPVNPTYFSSIVQHEAGGHGFGNLADEYVNYSGSIPQTQSDILTMEHNYSVFLNVDLTNDSTRILWKHFFGLTKYSYVGIYEGGFLYAKGVWRSEDNSLMRNNIKYINAPGREIIVKRIINLAGQTYSFADFQTKDVMELTASLKSQALLFNKSLQLAPPVIMQ